MGKMDCPHCGGTGQITDNLRVINLETGEVRETTATMVGVNALENVLINEIKLYQDAEYLRGRDIKQDILIEGHPFFKKILEKRFYSML
jgi:hypothetical protein